MENNKTHDDNNTTEEIRKRNEEFAAEALEMFLSSYPPAKDINEATRFFTTNEIDNIIRNVFPTAIIDLYSISVFLKTNNYKYAAMLDEFNPGFKWMVK